MYDHLILSFYLELMKLIFATNNENKVAEIRAVTGNKFNIITLKEAGIDIDIPEPYDTIEENASTKSATIYHMTQTNCFSEDTGLEVESLSGEPGVKSARYAGDVDAHFRRDGGWSWKGCRAHYGRQILGRLTRIHRWTHHT